MMMLIVIVMVTLAVAAVSAALRLERSARRYELSSEPVEHVLDHMIGPNSEKLIVNFGGQMPISQMPGEARKLIGVLMSDLDNGLGSGVNLYQPPIVELQTVSVGHRDHLRKIEKDIFALVRGQANATAMARFKIEGDRARGPFPRPMSGRAMN
jgi:hypothetical protein